MGYRIETTIPHCTYLQIKTSLLQVAYLVNASLGLMPRRDHAGRENAIGKKEFTMDLLTVDAAACTRDGMCAKVCPLGCIEMGADGLPRETPDALCMSCGHCVSVCPHGALTNSLLDARAGLPVSTKMANAQAVRDLMLSRRSIRAYKDKLVAPETLAWLLDTSRFAPTTSNTQKVSWIACLDPAKTRSVAELISEWMRRSVHLSVYMKKMVEMWDQGQDSILHGAPAFVAAYSPADYVWGAVDCGIALTYMELAAASTGLGACWVGILVSRPQN